MKEAAAAAAAARYGAEGFGTFVLVFTLGCNAHSESVAVALSIGSVLIALIYAFGPVSGGHFNPAVTFALHLADRSKISLQDFAGYMAAQGAGAVAGALTYFYVVGHTLILRPAGLYTGLQVAAVEVIYTSALCYVFLNVVCGVPGSHYGFAIGSTVTAAAIAAGPISGCSLNPAVAVGSMFVAGSLHGIAAADHFCVYLFAPFVGAALGTLGFFCAGGGSLPRLGHSMEHCAEEEPIVTVEQRQKWRAAKAAQRSPFGTIDDTPRQHAQRAEAHALRVVKHTPFTLPMQVIGHDLFFACRWRMRQSLRRGDPVVTCDIDLSCAKMSYAGEHMGGIYFAQARDVENGIRHSGDEIMGEGASATDNELIRFCLSDIKPSVFALIFFVGIFDVGQSFGDVTELHARLVDESQRGQELCRYEKKDFLPEANALIAAMLHRQGSSWVFKAVDEAFALPAHSSYRKLLPEMQELVRKVQPQSAMSSPSGSQR